MRRLWRLIREILMSIVGSIRADFEPEIRYTPYEPKVLGNRLKEYEQ